MKSVINIYFVLPLTFTVNAVKFVDRCPASEDSWKQRAHAYNCSVKDQKYYHCMKTLTSELVEFCSLPLYGEATKGICPFLRKYPPINIAFGPNLCDGDIGCPQDDDEGYFFTHELYKYPACLRYTVPTTHRQVTTRSTSQSSTIPESDSGKSNTWIRYMSTIEAETTPVEDSNLSTFVVNQCKKQSGFISLETFLIGLAGIIAILIITIGIHVDLSKRRKRQSSIISSLLTETSKRNEDVYDEIPNYVAVTNTVKIPNKMPALTNVEIEESPDKKDRKYNYAYEDFIVSYRKRSDDSSIHSFIQVIGDDKTVEEISSDVSYEEPVKNKYEKLADVKRDDEQQISVYTSLQTSRSTDYMPGTFTNLKENKHGPFIRRRNSI